MSVSYTHLVGMSPDNVIAGPIVMVLIFVIGHAINIFLNGLYSLPPPSYPEFLKNSTNVRRIG